MRQKNKVVIVGKKQVLCAPDPKWPRVDPGFLTMKQVSGGKDRKVYSFVKSHDY